MNLTLQKRLELVSESLKITSKLEQFEEIKVGNVNNTYKLIFADGRMFIAQEINTFVFKNPVAVMENIDQVSSHILAKNPDKITLHFEHSSDGKNYLNDPELGFWRMFNFIPSVTISNTNDLEIIRNAATAFGDFQTALSDFDAAKLHETIPNFHHTITRFQTLEADIKKDPLGRIEQVEPEIEYLFSVREKACELTVLSEAGKLPLRVTHNDTKINNVLFDEKTKQALTVIDLDTVMPGLVGHDFGDAIRSTTNVMGEDCQDLEKVKVDMDVFEAFTDGFLKSTAKSLTSKEIETLAMSSFCIAIELSTRFLDDYILGDQYFKIDYPDHNLVRTRCQIALAKDIAKNLDRMNEIVFACARKYQNEV